MSTNGRIQKTVGNPGSRSAEAEAKLMTRLRAAYDSHLIDATRDSSIIPEFLAALTANESGGDPRAQRFEPSVYRRLKDVAAGRLAGYGGVTKSLLDTEIAKAESAARQGLGGISDRPAEDKTTKPGSNQAQLPTTPAPPESGAGSGPSTAGLADAVIRRLATSWGLTQIMGYHLIGRPEQIERLLEPAFHYRMAVELLETFATRHHLDPRRDFEALFRCWNTGRPGGQTTDPAYAEKGRQRVELYRQLTAKDRQPAMQDQQPAAQKA